MRVGAGWEGGEENPALQASHTLESLWLGVEEGICCGGRLNNVKGKSTRTLGIAWTLTSSEVSPQPLHAMPTAASRSGMHCEGNPRADSMHPSFWPSCSLPEAEEDRDIKTTLPLHFIRKPERTSNLVHTADGPAGTGPVDEQSLQPGFLSQWIMAPAKMSTVSPSPEPVKSYSMWQRWLSRCN